MAFCRKCGIQIPDDSMFCSSCGAPQNAPQPQYQQNTPQPQYQPPYGYGYAQPKPPQYGSKKAIWSFILSILGALLSIAGFVLGIISVANMNKYIDYCEPGYPSHFRIMAHAVAHDCSITGIPLASVGLALSIFCLVFALRARSGYLQKKRETGINDNKTFVFLLIAIICAATGIALGVFGTNLCISTISSL